jgi:hypothetical protein
MIKSQPKNSRFAIGFSVALLVSLSGCDWIGGASDDTKNTTQMGSVDAESGTISDDMVVLDDAATDGTAIDTSAPTPIAGFAPTNKPSAASAAPKAGDTAAGTATGTAAGSGVGQTPAAPAPLQNIGAAPKAETKSTTNAVPKQAPRLSPSTPRSSGADSGKAAPKAPSKSGN